MPLALVVFLGVLGATSPADDAPSPEPEPAFSSPDGGDEAFWAAHAHDDGAGFYARYHFGPQWYERALRERFTHLAFAGGLQLGASWDRWIVSAEVGFSTLGAPAGEESDVETRRSLGVCAANRVLLDPAWALTAGLCYHHAWLPDVAGHAVDFDVAVAWSLATQREPGVRLRGDLFSAVRVSPLWLTDTVTDRPVEGLMIAWWVGMSFDIARWTAR